MEAVIRDDVSGKEATHEVSETATAGELLEEACRLFGREVLDSALEVDGAVVCTGVFGGVSGGEVSVGSLGVHSDSRLVLCRSRDRVLAAVAKWSCWDRSGRSSLPAWAWDDEVVALAAVEARSLTCQFVSERLRNGGSFMRDVVARTHGSALKHAGVELRSDRELVLAAVAKDGSAMAYASEELKSDKEFVLALVANCRHSLRYVSDIFKADKQVALAAVTRNARSLRYVSDSLRADKEVVMIAVAQGGHSLEFASDSLRADKQVVLAAAAQNGDSLLYASESLRADKEVGLVAVANSGLAKGYLSEELQADDEILAVCCSGASR